MQVRIIKWNKALGQLQVVVAGLCFGGCITPFGPPASLQSTHLLVVEGFINSSQGATQILLTRTLSDTSQPIAETGAHVSVEDGQGNDYPLTETGNGNYVLSSLGGDTTGVFRLRIQTSTGAQYLSDFDTATHTPPIDSITWALLDGNVQIYANTHDPSGQVKYYRWSYRETWEFKSFYGTDLIWVHGEDQVDLKPQDDNIDSCWRSDSSTNILAANSTGLSQDQVSLAPLVNISDHSQELSVKYSILVNQYGLSEPAYHYWGNLQKSTQQLGTIFDPQPFTASGNLHCLTNPGEIVIGFVNAGTMQQQRIFISNASLPSDWNIPPQCPLTEVAFEDEVRVFGSGDLAPLGQWGNSGYYGTPSPCVDCTTSGSNVEPSFWQ